MSIDLYIDDDDGYRGWLNRNPRGYVINIQRSLNPSDARLHDAACRDLINQLGLDVKLTEQYVKACGETQYVKACGETQAELDHWAADNVGEPIQPCDHCHDPRDTRPLCPNCFLELPSTGKCSICDED